MQANQITDCMPVLKQAVFGVRLLMDYPFVKQTSADYATHIASLSNKESQKQVSANTVRILLLEEQNSELRERLIAMAREHRHSQPHGRIQVHTHAMISVTTCNYCVHVVLFATVAASNSNLAE